MENRDNQVNQPASNPDHGSMGGNEDEHREEPSKSPGQERDTGTGQDIAEKERDPSDDDAGAGEHSDEPLPGSQNDRPGRQ